MPNHCTNEITVSFETENDCKDFLHFVSGADSEGEISPFTFNKIIPLPKRSEQFPNGKWDYNWCRENWGTKWDAYDVNVEREGEQAQIFFLTAWGPPHPIIRKLDKLFKFEYIRWFYRDEADMFCGYLDIDEGINDD